MQETYGVIVYQEQVMQVANKLAGYSLGDADLLRRAMGKKKAEEMAQQRDRFVKGALERNYPQKKIEKIFDLMEQFAGYGFNKSHSAAYAYLAYVTAYLKAHYADRVHVRPADVGNGQHGKVVKYMNECRDMGIRVLPPDVNKSDMNFTPDGDAIRFGLCAIKNVGEGAVESIIDARNEDGPFTSIYNFCERVDLSAREPPRDREPDPGGRDGFAPRDAISVLRRNRLGDGNRAAGAARQAQRTDRPVRHGVRRLRG